MIRLMPWAAGASELVARPAPSGRVQGLIRITAPTRSRWFWLTLWTIAAAASFTALIPVLFDRGPPVVGFEVIHTLSGISFAAWGLVAWHRRPDSSIGRLLTVAGFGVLLGPILTQL